MNLKKLLSFFLAVILVFSLSANYIFAESKITSDIEDIPNQKKENANIYQKIHVYSNNVDSDPVVNNASELTSALSDFQNNIYRTTDISSSLGIAEITVEFYSGFGETTEFKAFSSERKHISSVEEMRNFRMRLNNFSRQYHAELINKYLPLLSSFDYDMIDVIDYSPYVRMELNSEIIKKSELIKLAENDNVLNIYLKSQELNEQEISNSVDTISAQVSSESNGTVECSTWNEALQHIGAYDVVSSGEYTGEGIKIGILEAVGNDIYDVNNPNFANKNITILTPSNTTNPHATKVLSVATLIAPDAEYYFANASTTGFELFVHEGCDIVNMSFGSATNGYTTPGDSLQDYHAYYHYITTVTSAGNVSNGNTQITSPGYGYNVITIGGVVQTTLNKIIHAPGARYGSTTPICKPNVSAIYNVQIPNCGEVSGTSYAAPQVTACIALMAEYMISQRNYSINLFPESIMAVLTATASKTDDYVSYHQHYDDKVGAGIINLERMISGNTTVTDYTGNNVTEGMEFSPVAVYLEPGQELQLALSILVDVDMSDSIDTIEFTNYNIYICPLMGSTILASSNFSNDSNVEMLRFTPSSAGSYRIVICAYDNIITSDRGDLIAWAYNISE